MRKRSEYFELTLLVAGFGLAWLFKTIFEGLFYSTIIKFLESRFGLMEADVIAKFSAIAVPSAASFVVIWAIYRFIEKNLRQEFALENRPRLKLSYAPEKTLKHSNGSKQTFLYAINEGTSDVSDAQVKIEEAQYRKDGSDKWEGTSIVSRTNMSWGHVPDGDPQKYSTVALAPGSEVVDFISGPHNFQQQDGQTRLGFLIRIDPRHWRNVNPAFFETGTYKFAMQTSASDVENPAKPTLFVDWDGKSLVIRSDNPSEVLETAGVLEV